MTAEELERIVRQGDQERLIAAMAPLDEAQRKKLAKTAAGLLRLAKSSNVDAIRQAIQTFHFIASDNPNVKNTEHFKNVAELAVLGLCSWTQAKGATPFFWGVTLEGDKNPIYRVLVARKPEWIDQWVQQQLDSRMCDWMTIRRLVREGACNHPVSESYIRWMIRSHAGSWMRRKDSLADSLREDCSLLGDEIWKIFEIDLGGEMILSGSEDDSDPISWQWALRDLSRSNELDRDRLLTASLTALNRPVQAANASWFFKFHESLSPTLDERLKRQEEYLDLLASAVPAVAGFALGVLKVLAQAGKLDVERFAAAVAPVFDLRPKTHPAAAAGVLRLAAKQSPEYAGMIAAAAARGLSHPSPDVQKSCTDLIESLAAGSDAALAEAIEAQLESVTASQKPRIEAVLAKIKIAAEPDIAEETSPAELPSDAEIEAIPRHWRELAGIDACRQAMIAGGELPRLVFNPMSVPRLDPANVLTPIQNLDELIERASAAVEELKDADELELLLDAIGRFADQRPLDFEIRTAPLLKRVDDLLNENRWAGLWLEARVRLRLLVKAWLRRQPMPPPHGKADWITPIEFVSARMERVSHHVAAGKSTTLLACPTHRGGWLDPRVLVQRLHVWQQSLPSANVPGNDHLPDIVDFTQSLLRLAPDHRVEALAAAKDLNGQTGAAARFALGDAESIGRHAAIWIAAARARDPRGKFPELSMLHGELGPDAAEPAMRTWDIIPSETVPGKADLAVSVTPALTREQNRIDRPLAMLNHLPRVAFVTTTIPNIRCRQAIWPVNPDSSFAEGTIVIVDRLHSPASTLTPTAPYLEPLFDSNTAFSEIAQLALAAGLVSNDAGTRGLAIDALIALISDGRCIGDELGSVFGKLSQAKGMLHLNRVADSLSDAARVSPLHRHVAISVIQGTLAGVPQPTPGDLHHLLTPLHEWLLLTGEPLSPACRPILETIAGSGKTASLAKSLLKLPENGGRGHRRTALAEALRGRITRASRWAGGHSPSQIA